MGLPDWLIAAARRAPLYGALPDRPAWPLYSHTAEDLEAAGDAFGGRHDPTRPPDVLIQAAADLPVYWALTAGDLSALAKALANAWSSLGIVSRQRIALYDYAASPMVVFASRAYVSHLDAGAAERLGCLPICNDGLPDLADRCVHILEYMRPEVVFVDAALMHPLLQALKRKAFKMTSRIVVAGDESPVGPEQIARWSKRLNLEVRQMLRADAALFFAPSCAARPMTFHPDESAYHVEVVGPAAVGRIAVSNLAVRSSVVIRYVTGLSGVASYGPCACGRAGLSVIIEDAG